MDGKRGRVKKCEFRPQHRGERGGGPGGKNGQGLYIVKPMVEDKGITKTKLVKPCRTQKSRIKKRWGETSLPGEEENRSAAGLTDGGENTGEW